MPSFLETYPNCAAPPHRFLNRHRSLSAMDLATIQREVATLPVSWWSFEAFTEDLGGEDGCGTGACLRQESGPSFGSFSFHRRGRTIIVSRCNYDAATCDELDPTTSVKAAMQSVRQFILEALEQWGLRPV